MSITSLDNFQHKVNITPTGFGRDSKKIDNAQRVPAAGNDQGNVADQQTRMNEKVDSFLDYFTVMRNNIIDDHAKDNISPENIQSINDTLKDIAQGILDEPEINAELGLQKAHDKAVGAMMKFEAQIMREANGSPSDPTPCASLIQKPSGEFSLIKATPPVKSIVVPGGGGKGRAYEALFGTLKNYLSQVEKVTGTSAGSMAAICLSLGMSVERFADILNANSPVSLLEAMPGNQFDMAYGHLGLTFTKIPLSDSVQKLLDTLGKESPIPLAYDAQKLIEVFDRETYNEIRSFLTKNSDTVSVRLKSLRDNNEITQEQFDKFKMIKETAFDASTSREGKMITFNDIAALKKLSTIDGVDNVPFKDLTIIGSKFAERGEKKWQNLFQGDVEQEARRMEFREGDEHGDMPIALAARISMSIPPVFNLVTTSDRTPGIEAGVYMDGGPQGNFFPDADINPDPAQTGESLSELLMVAFGDAEQQDNSQIHSAASLFNKLTNTIVDNLLNFSAGSIDLNSSMGTRWAQEREFLTMSTNVLELGTGNIGTFSLDPSPEDVELALAHAEYSAEQFLYNRNNEGVEVPLVNAQTGQEITDRDEATTMAMEMLNESEIDAIVRYTDTQVPEDSTPKRTDSQVALDQALHLAAVKAVHGT